MTTVKIVQIVDVVSEEEAESESEGTNPYTIMHFNFFMWILFLT